MAFHPPYLRFLIGTTVKSGFSSECSIYIVIYLASCLILFSVDATINLNIFVRYANYDSGAHICKALFARNVAEYQ